MTTIEIFVKGDAHTPSRFWDYALRTETKHSRFYNQLGFMYSKKDTEEYIKLSENERKKINFTYINGNLQKF